MIPKTKLLEKIEDYCLDNLNRPEKDVFESELSHDSELRDEVEFENALQSAILEKDILNLREKLQSAKNTTGKNSAPFDILEDFDNVQQLSETLSPEELLKFYDSLPKAHIYQHELVSNENIHEFFREQMEETPEEDFFSGESDEFEFEALGLEEAVLETDIINLRETLSKVSASVRGKCSVEEVDNYLNSELSSSEMERFEHELSVNSLLQREVKVHQELEQAILEPDIMDLRSQLQYITQSETSWNVSEDQIEYFINDELKGKDLKDFLAEYNENSGLKAEVALRKNVDASLAETDIFSLRDKLHQVKAELKNREVRSLVPETDNHFRGWLRAGVAVAVVLVAFAGMIGNYFGGYNASYDEYFQAPQWTPHRTVASDAGVLQQANSFFQNGNYEQALLLYEQAIAENDEKFVFQFYKASTLQNMEQYKEAIPEYTAVVEHGDNMFVEEAEWYKALCYFKLDDKESARKQLLAIVNRNGYFANDAKAVLRKTRFSLR